MVNATGPVRIGEFARRVGVSPESLRAWERRYGLLRPVRSTGGFRLYTDEDAERVARMRHAIDEGLSAAEAASVALEGGVPADDLVLRNAVPRLLAAIERFDEDTVQAVLDESLAGFGFEAVLREVILPTLTQVGLRWEQGTLAISHEHFASNLIRGRLLSLARLWSRGRGPLAVLACAPHETHDITLLAFGLVLRSHGWRILFLGANTPIATLAQTVTATHPDLAVLTSFDPAALEAEKAALRDLARTGPLVLGGPGVTGALCRRLGIQRLQGDLVEAATQIARRHED